MFLYGFIDLWKLIEERSWGPWSSKICWLYFWVGLGWVVDRLYLRRRGTTRHAVHPNWIVRLQARWVCWWRECDGQGTHHCQICSPFFLENRLLWLSILCLGGRFYSTTVPSANIAPTFVCAIDPYACTCAPRTRGCGRGTACHSISDRLSFITRFLIAPLHCNASRRTSLQGNIRLPYSSPIYLNMTCLYVFLQVPFMIFG